jgi:outer membrane protein OmpA-like peptidoglycan-associated protein
MFNLTLPILFFLGLFPNFAFSSEQVIKWTTEIVNDELILTLPEKIHFTFDSDDLTSTKSAKELADFMESFGEPLVLTVVGYTDSVGSDPYNSKLSLNRAEAFKEILLSIGVDSDSVIVRGDSHLNPIEDVDGKSHINRRLELFLSYK